MAYLIFNHLPKHEDAHELFTFSFDGIGFSPALHIACERIDPRRSELPRGTVVELHSCELYAGGCVVSSEAPQNGRYMLRVWNFSTGGFKGAEFSGLNLAVLQVSEDNLAAPDSRPGDAVVYLPEKASEPQRQALLAWLKSSQPGFKSAHLQTRTASLQLTGKGEELEFAAGNLLSLKTSPMNCDSGACGEALWYQPRTATGSFAVVVNRSARIDEPLLKLSWQDAGRRSVFVARFGEPTAGNRVRVQNEVLCGIDGVVF